MARPTGKSLLPIGAAAGLVLVSDSTGIGGWTGLGAGFGATGVAGPTGIQGNTGVAGQTGARGYTGTQGIQGTQGNQGVTGLVGLQGNTGVAGATGVQGIQGNTGVQGIQGNTGVAGATGVQGIQGNTGLRGNTGVDGTTGLLGNTGVAGATGVQGIQGNTGVQGIQGNTGVAGATGVQGIQGNTGILGATGVAQPYSVQTQSTAYNMVSTDYMVLMDATAGTFQVNLPSAPPNGSQYLVQLIATGGHQGRVGLQGTDTWYSGGATFKTLSSAFSMIALIYYNGVYYLDQATGPAGATGVAGTTGVQGILGNTGVAGATGTGQGATGVAGQTGLRGTTGVQGIQGNTGVAGQTGVGPSGTQAANAVYSGPSSGAAALPTFRSLAVQDIPVLDNTKLPAVNPYSVKVSFSTSSISGGLINITHSLNSSLVLAAIMDNSFVIHWIPYMATSVNVVQFNFADQIPTTGLTWYAIVYA